MSAAPILEVVRGDCHERAVRLADELVRFVLFDEAALAAFEAAR